MNYAPPGYYYANGELVRDPNYGGPGTPQSGGYGISYYGGPPSANPALYPSVNNGPGGSYAAGAGTGGGGGGGGGGAPAAAGATTPGGYDPSLTVAANGDVIGYKRQFDPATGNYGYVYTKLGTVDDLAAVATASGMPVSYVQQQVSQQQLQNNTVAYQSGQNPYSTNGSMTVQQQQQATDAQAAAQAYARGQGMAMTATPGGPTYLQQGIANDQRTTAFQYANGATLDQSQLASATMNNSTYANWNAPSAAYPGMTNGQVAQMAGNYQNQASADQGVNYNASAGSRSGQTYGQQGIANQNSGSNEAYDYHANYAGANPYTGMSNGATGLAASNAGNAASLTRDTYALTAGAGTGGQSRIAYEQGTKDITDPYDRTQAVYNSQNQAGDLHLRDLNRQYDTTAGEYNLGSADYTNGATRQQYLQGTQDIRNPYDRADAIYKAAHQGAQQSLDTYKEGLQTAQAVTNGQSRNLAGLGWVGLQRPSISGWA